MQAETTCIFCRLFKDNLTCKAFPEGIPEDILDGRADHHEPYPGDNGIMFEPIPE